MPIGDPADPLYAPYNKRQGKTREEDDAIKSRMKQDVDVALDNLRQENLNKIFAKLAELQAMIDGARGDFPIKVTTGQNGIVVSIDQATFKNLLSASLQLQDRCVNGFAGQQQVWGLPPVPIESP